MLTLLNFGTSMTMIRYDLPIATLPVILIRLLITASSERAVSGCHVEVSGPAP